MSQNQSPRQVTFFLFSRHLLHFVLLTMCVFASTLYAREVVRDVERDIARNAERNAERNAGRNAEIEPSAARLFKSSGLQELIAQIPSSTASAFEATLSAGELPERFKQVAPDAIRLAVSEAFTTATFDKYLIREIDQSMSEESKNLMLAWYASPMGYRIKRAEIDNSLLSEKLRFEEYQQQLLITSVDARREQLIYRMDEIIHSTEAAVDMMADVQIAFNLSLSRFLPEEQRLSRADIQMLAKRNHALLMAQYRSQTREVLLFTYQEFDNDELRELNDTLATEAGQEFVAAINNGIKKGMFAASLNLGDELGELLGDDVYGPGI